MPTADGRSDLRVACIGVGGQGRVDARALDRLARVVAVCDVDQRALAAARKAFPHAAFYRDYRRLLDREEQRIDAVTISTPDHSHAPAALEAIERGKHCFCQKPLATSVRDARHVARAARSSGVVTQLGIQGLFHLRARAAMAVVDQGVLGTVREVHAWSDRPAEDWPQRRPAAAIPSSSVKKLERAAPPWLDWNLWLGPAARRPYHDEFHPRSWRGWRDFGTGALGDIGSHTLALAFLTLALGPPLQVRADWESSFAGCFPARERLILELPREEDATVVTVYWYDGGETPPPELFDDVRLDENGVVLIGTEGRLYLPGCLNQYLYLLPRERFADYTFFRGDEAPVPSVYQEWVTACEYGTETSCGFGGFTAALTETLLVGNLSVRLERDIQWDAESMTVPGCNEATNLVAPEWREW